MKHKNQWHVYFLYIILFFFLNILNTYLLTVQELNRYIAPFRHTFSGDLNAFFGNLSVLFIITVFSFIFIKKAKARMLFLLFFSLFLNIFIFAMGIFNMFFGTAFSIPAATIFNNPADGFALGTFYTALLEIITYYRIIAFLPTIILFVIYRLSDRTKLKQMYFKVTVKKVLSALLLASIMLFGSISSYYEQFQKTMPINSVKSTFAIQTLGVYPYYVGEFFGKPFDVDLKGFLDLNTDRKLADAYQEYNKNQSSYVNFFDQNMYSNRLDQSQAVSNLYIDPSILQGDNLHGILEGRNLVIIHLESLNSFLLEHEATNSRLKFLNTLLSESFYFSNFYNNVGMGVSSDAELSVLTGLYPMGDRTLYWEHDKLGYDLLSIPKYFNQIGYQTLAIHGDHQKFYNRDFVYPDLFKFDEFYSIENFIEDGYDITNGFIFNEEKNLVHQSPWISDYYLADYTNQRGRKMIDEGVPFMMFPVTMMPHTPYEFDPHGLRFDTFPQFANLIQRITLRYINYVDYVDEVIERFFIGSDGSDQTLDNTVYLFYSDHGSGIKNGDLDILFNHKFSVIETRQMLQKVPAWIYVPSDQIITKNGYQLREGLIKGEQNLVRSQVDLFRTMIELFNLPVGNNPYFGVHGFSVEPTFALDNRLMDVAMDDYFFSMRNKRFIYPSERFVEKERFEYIKRFKMLSDILVAEGKAQVEIYEAVRRYYG
jgi:phosphoglycerol transferase MdoB-like AlkP superfamily enzyme